MAKRADIEVGSGLEPMEEEHEHRFKYPWDKLLESKEKSPFFFAPQSDKETAKSRKSSVKTSGLAFLEMKEIEDKVVVVRVAQKGEVWGVFAWLFKKSRK